MKRCPICKTAFPDDANFCPMDAGQLVDEVPAAASVPSAPGGHNTGQDAGLVGGRFKLGARLGGTHTGEVYIARDTSTGQDCAVKVVSPALFPTPLIAQRTERELKQLQKLSSERVGRILDFGRQGPSTWIAMELISATPLSKLVGERGRLSEDRARKIALEVGEGLAEAAGIGVIHRDVAPKNVLLLDGDRVKLINFSLPVPATDRLFGVPEFISPEQAEGKAVDQRSNIYSLGALLYYMLVGQPPFAGELGQVIQAHLHSAPVPPSTRVQGMAFSAGLERVVMKALEKSSSRRQLTLRQMMTEIEGGGAQASGPAALTAPAAGDPGRTMFGYAVARADGALGAPSHGAGQAGAAPQAPIAPMASPQAMGHAPPAMAQPPVAQPPPASQSPVAPAPVAQPHAAQPHVAQPHVAQPVAHGPGPGYGQAPVATQPDAYAGYSAPPPQAAAPPPAAAAIPAASAPASTSSSPRGKARAGTEPPPPSKKGQFRETMWFKKGELDEAAAEAAATAPRSPDALPVVDKADELPIEDRYKDDGTISARDRERLSLKTGHTAMMEAIKVSPKAGKGGVSEKELMRELGGGKGRLWLAAIFVLLIIGSAVAFYVTRSRRAATSDSPAAPAAPATPAKQ